MTAKHRVVKYGCEGREFEKRKVLRRGQRRNEKYQQPVDMIRIIKRVCLCRRRMKNVVCLPQPRGKWSRWEWRKSANYERKYHLTAVPSSQRRHGQDKTRQFCLVSTQFPICSCSVWNISRTTENCLDLSPMQFTPPTRTRQGKTVLCCLVRVSGVKLIKTY